MIDPGFKLSVLIWADPGDQGILRIGNDINAAIFVTRYNLIERYFAVIGKCFVINDIPGAAVGDPSSVKRENVTSVFFQLKLFRKWKDALCWASACKHYFFAVFLDLDQSVQRWFGDFFF